MNQLPSILLSWLLAICAWSPVGLWLLAQLKAELKDRPLHNFILATLLGAAVNATVLGLLSFYMPITAKVSVWLAILGVIPFIPRFMQGSVAVMLSVRFWSVMSWIGFAAFVVITLMCSVHTSLNNDSGLYYIQFMEWINSYPVVPGLANLHDRLGFNSHWHLLNATFDMKALGLKSTNDLNGLLFILMGLGAFQSANSHINRHSMSDAVWVLLPVPFFLLLRFLTSTAPDLPATLIPMVYFAYLVGEKEKSSLPVLVALIAFATTVKVLSVLHLLSIVPVLYWTVAHRKLKSLALAVLFGLVVISPWVARNVVQTGYPIFPMESIDVFSFDWKVPHQLAANARMMIDTHARLGSYDLADYGKPLSEWFPFWYSVQSKSVLALFIFVIASAVLMLVYALLKLLRKRISSAVFIDLFVALTVLMSVEFWWLTGPNPRFIYAIMFFFFAFALGSAGVFFKMGKWMRYWPLLALIPMMAITRTISHEEGPKRPTEFATMPSMETPVYYSTTTDKCWDHDLPCTTNLRTDLQLRGTELKDGFVNKGN